MIYDNTEVSGFYTCLDDPVLCDSGTSLGNWVEVRKEGVTMVDRYTLSITLEFEMPPTFSLAYVWRETPVKRYLGLPVYGTHQHYRLPSPPWKKFCEEKFCY